MPEKKTPPGQEKKEAAPQGKDKREAPPQEKDKDKREPPRPQEHAMPPQQTQPSSPQPPPPGQKEGPRAALQFLPGWEQRRQGQISPGGKLIIEFDPSRLPQCRQSSHGAQVWDIEVGMIFHPGGQCFVGSVMKKVCMPEGGPTVSLEPQPYEVTVPADATHVEMWFKNYTTIGGQGCEAWDSRYCQNYWFTVTHG
jgi:hypothetical protein